MLPLGLMSRALAGFALRLLADSSLENQRLSSDAVTRSGERTLRVLLLGRDPGGSACSRAEAVTGMSSPPGGVRLLRAESGVVRVSPLMSRSCRAKP